MSQSCVFSTIMPDNLPLHYCLNISQSGEYFKTSQQYSTYSTVQCSTLYTQTDTFLAIPLFLTFQELPMDQMNLAGGDQHQTHLDR